MGVYFVQTSDPERVIRVPSNEQDGPPEIIAADSGPLQYSLVNTLKSSAMTEVRAEAKAHGLRLHKPGVMGFMSFDQREE